jgi:probable phosphoglycerate mutase
MPDDLTSAARGVRRITTAIAPPRRRIVLMRHGSVDYFDADGRPLPPHGVPLNPAGRAQADAAGRLFAQAGVRFDRAVTSGLPRTVETATRALAAAGQPLRLDEAPALQEIRPGRLDAIPRHELAAAFTRVFDADAAIETHRFLGGESIGELLDRALPAFDALLADPSWKQLLLVLHGGVNRALLARAITGHRAFFGRLEQAPGCINLIDVGPADMVVRAVNLAPTQWLHEHDRTTTMEKLLAQYLQPGDAGGQAS